MPETSTQIHATCVALGGHGILLRGPSGSGKSDLALRLIAEAGARLVADDQCRLTKRGGALIARAPAVGAGCIEARGLGLLRVPAASEVAVTLVLDLVPRAEQARVPQPDRLRLCGVDVRRGDCDPFESGVVAKLALAAGRENANMMACDAPLADAGRAEREERRRMRDDEPGKDAEARDARRSGTATSEPPRVVVVTGMSGAGRSTTLKALEDVGYEAIDNLPLHLIAQTVHDGGLAGPVAVGVDIRTRNFAVRPFLEALEALDADPKLSLTLVFVDCEDEVLRRRFTETRRRHPLAQGRPLSDGITAERRLVAPLRARADMLIDTSTLSVADLRRVVGAQLGLREGGGMAVFVLSFSYRNGVPREADLVFDARFLRNPHYEESLRPLTGRDEAVVAFIADDPDYPAFIEDLCNMLRRLIPRYQAEGKSYLTIAIGCTGGRHRSVAVAERVGACLAREGGHVLVNHRELTSEGDRGDARDANSR